MGTMTLSEFRTDLSEVGLKGRGDISNARLDRWINRAYLDVTHPSIFEHDIFKTTYDITLATDDADYTLASTTVGYTVLGIRSVRYHASTTAGPSVQGRKLDPESIQEYDDRVHSSGSPAWYVGGEGEQILVSPTPSSSENGHILRCRLWREAAILSTDSSTTVIPANWDYIVYQGSVWRAQIDLGYLDAATPLIELYQGLINQLDPKRVLDQRDTGQQTPILAPSYMEISR
ncbi:MAG: hypothetical protein GY737_00290 [Desulfobacteraceae bacterium]|nr:hypothetical protein [Desulfobacteraceae bacterium]